METDGHSSPPPNSAESENSASDRGANPPDEDEEEDSGVSWAKAGLAGALGFEFVALLVGGLFAGYWVDEQLQSAPVGMLIGLFAGMLAATVHIWRMATRLLGNNSDSER